MRDLTSVVHEGAPQQAPGTCPPPVVPITVTTTTCSNADTDVATRLSGSADYNATIAPFSPRTPQVQPDTVVSRSPPPTSMASPAYPAYPASPAAMASPASSASSAYDSDREAIVILSDGDGIAVPNHPTQQSVNGMSV